MKAGTAMFRGGGGDFMRTTGRKRTVMVGWWMNVREQQRCRHEQARACSRNKLATSSAQAWRKRMVTSLEFQIRITFFMSNDPY
jgi:hypothetical protein